MKEFTLKTRSLHYRLATGYGSIRARCCMDLCSYLKYVMYGLLKIIFGVAAVSVVLVMVGVADLIGWIGAISVHGFVAPEEEARMALGMIFGIALAAIITFVVYTLLKAFYRWEDARNERKFNRRFEYREPTFFQMAYQSFKEKTCVKINFDYEK